MTQGHPAVTARSAGREKNSYSSGSCQATRHPQGQPAPCNGSIISANRPPGGRPTHRAEPMGLLDREQWRGAASARSWITTALVGSHARGPQQSVSHL